MVRAHEYTTDTLSCLRAFVSGKIWAKVGLPSRGIASSDNVVFERVPFCRIKCVRHCICNDIVWSSLCSAISSPGSLLLFPCWTDPVMLLSMCPIELSAKFTLISRNGRLSSILCLNYKGSLVAAMLVCLIWGDTESERWVVYLFSAPEHPTCHLPHSWKTGGASTTLPSEVGLLQMPIKDETLKAVSLSRWNQEY